MKPRVGLIEIGRKASPEERDYAAWAEEQGLWVATEWATGEDGREVPILSLGIDEMIDNEVHSYYLSPVRGGPWPEARRADEALLRAGFGRYKARLTPEYRYAVERIAIAFGLTPEEVRDPQYELASDEAHARRTVFMDALFDQAKEIVDRLTVDYLAQVGE